MPNRLATSSSPYLRQHADNPVDWFEWGEDAFAEARRRDVPIFLSVGYSSCHWCHVMAHESFEDAAVAAVMNERFVNVKVDREQRPDVDSVYMSAVQALTGHGGWPMSVFLTHDGTPFYAGTYWPMQRRGQLPSFTEVLHAVSGTWAEERDTVLERAGAITDHLRHAADLGDGQTVDEALLDTVATLATSTWDQTHGGFGRQPKFPQAMVLDFLLAHHQRTGDPQSLSAAVHSLERMSRGGIRDHVGGGFARYSVDQRWLVPHFEKMLYDNALMLRAFTHAWQITGQARFARVARETGRYLIDGLGQPEGGFSSATDADSEGVEGKFFIWTAEEFDEVIAAVGEDVRHWRERLGVTDEGNWHDPHGHAPPRANILHEVVPFEEGDPGFARRWAAVRQALDERRRMRVPPGLDDKVLVSWNALAIAALAEAGAVLDEPEFVAAARRAVDFIRETLVVDGVLHHTWSPGHDAEVPALLEDVAMLARGLLVLFEADPDPMLVTWAVELAAQAEDQFADGEGLYFSSPDGQDGPTLIVRPMDEWDNAQPSGASVMVEVNTRLAALTGDQAYRTRAEQTLTRFGDRVRRAPLGYGEMALAAERLLAGPLEVAIVGPEAAAMSHVVRDTWMPGVILALADEPTDAVPLLASRPLVDGQTTAYVCRGSVCDAPTTDVSQLALQLSAARAVDR